MKAGAIGGKPQANKRYKPQLGGQELPPVEVQIDWRAYWEEFKAQHGIPVEHNGRCLFPDGWQYGMDHYWGPECLPPENKQELEALQLAYWTTRKALVQRELTNLQRRLSNIQEYQSCHSLPIQQRTRFQTEGSDGLLHWESRTEPLDLTGLEGRIGWLANDLEECDKELKGLTGCPS